MLVKNRKYIVVAGSIMSGLGKGIVTSSIGKLLQARGYKVIPIKFDGYLNVDCGTMNPFRHGEVFVLDDGTEVDMDFGTYERFLDISLTKTSSITGGKLFKTIIEKERKGEYLGRDVQFVPHLTDEIKGRVKAVGEESGADIILVEVGGTVGDLENGYFLEAMRQLNFEERGNLIFIQLTYIPSLSLGEQKTKPTQHATRVLQAMGIQPNIIMCREQEKLTADVKKKISLYCNIREEAVFDDPLVKTVYDLPLALEKQGLIDTICDELGIPKKEADLKNWKNIVGRIMSEHEKKANIAIVGKYTAVKDAYVSVKEAVIHAAAANNIGVEIGWVESTDLEIADNAKSILKDYDGIIVPGGYGARGIEGKIRAINHARESKLPYVGLCLGMQLMVIEYARNVCKLEGANSTEFDKKTAYPVIDLLPEQRKMEEMGATNRLGAYECKLKKGTEAYKAYGAETVHERHRHRWEVNPDFAAILEKGGLVISGVHPKSNIVEIVEWPDGFGIGTQPHIELKSRLENPAPVFVAFMKAVKERLK
ncbi:CTP synthase [Candidatus Micrarchaeota archaeon]|nr:CTP synthase [Candidatus Micrarchaeota archaeon]